ncbi:hypothetical protein CARUB_v10021723mg [Capsella rubella]|uniref:Protein kinase domain-containing protein n=1 Tax=Capsella rubella TaxID=81985 RepID=R0GEH4_9BRAS|nr:hypothetical protein CARUB_v10021723mg [Capsella rubella]
MVKGQRLEYSKLSAENESVTFHSLSIRLAHSELSSSLGAKVNVEGAWTSDLQSQDVSGLNFFEIQDLQTATNNFGVLNRLAQGGFGTVYKSCTPGSEDHAASDSVYSAETGRCVHNGLLCVQHQAIDRPNIKQVMSLMLTSTTDLPKPTEPMIVTYISDEDSSLSQRSIMI